MTGIGLPELGIVLVMGTAIIALGVGVVLIAFRRGSRDR
jgi:hypothetical protein